MPEWSRVARRIRVPLGFAFAACYLWLARPTLRSMLVGLVLVLIGLWIRALASGHVRKNEALATTGPYAYTRNPLYLGSLLMGIGFAVMGRSWWIGLALVAMFFAIYLPVIRGEEAFLRNKFADFQDYASRVPRLFPRLTPHADESRVDAGFSMVLYRKHREYNATFGVVALIALLIVKMRFWPS